MAIPLIIGIGAAAVGAYKTAKAISDNNDAQDISKEANSIVKRAEQNLKETREKCNTSLKTLGEQKAHILRYEVDDFLTSFGKLKNFVFETNNLNELNAKEFNAEFVREIKNSVSMVEAAGLGFGGGAVSGALTAFGAYNATMALAAAGTGTAISSLSGAAATNATLAWLGGGTLASGGMGIAGGTMALGALAAGPALLVAGWYMGSKAEENLNEARSNYAKAERYTADVKAAIAMIDGISEVAELSKYILQCLAEYIRPEIQALNELIHHAGTNYSRYSEAQKTVVLRNIKLIQVIKTVIDTPILDKNGCLLGESESSLARIHRDIKNPHFLEQRG